MKADCAKGLDAPRPFGGGQGRYRVHIERLAREEPPVLEVFDELRRDLQLYLNDRGLRRLSPQLLGYPELESWSRRDDLDRLSMDCYDWALYRRRRGLSCKLAVYENLDGLVRRNVDNFLGYRQQRNDPVGNALYENCRGAAEVGVAKGWWITTTDAPGERLHHPTSAPTAPAIEPPQLRLQLRRLDGWGAVERELWACQTRLHERLAELLLAALMSEAFSFRVVDVVQAIRSEVREAWLSRFRAAVGGPDELTDHGSGHGELARRDFCRLIDLLRQEVRGQRKGTEVSNLERVFEEVAHHCLAAETDDELGQSELARRLGLSRSTVHDQIKRLRDLLIEIQRGPASDAPREAGRR